MALGGDLLGQEGREHTCAGSDRTAQVYHLDRSDSDLPPHRAEHSQLPIATVHGNYRCLEGSGQRAFDLGNVQSCILGQHPCLKVA